MRPVTTARPRRRRAPLLALAAVLAVPAVALADDGVEYWSGSVPSGYASATIDIQAALSQAVVKGRVTDAKGGDCTYVQIDHIGYGLVTHNRRRYRVCNGTLAFNTTMRKIEQVYKPPGIVIKVCQDRSHKTDVCSKAVQFRWD